MTEQNGRKKKSSNLLLIIALIIIGLMVIVVLWQKSKEPASAEPGRGMFEWNEAAQENPERAIELAQTLGINRWYQEFGDYDGASEFVAALENAGIEVYALLGSSEWGFEEDGASFIEAMGAIVSYNRENSDYPIRGVMADIEPYTRTRFKENPEESMELYVSGMEAAYIYAKANDLTLITCIARHYDDRGLTDALERLIQASDEVAVMNYDCGNEVEAIRTEAEFAEKHGKIIHCILEFQRVGKHGLVEEKTYRNKGLDAARAAFESVDSAYPKLNVIWDYHWTKPIYEMLDEEEG